MSIAARTWQLLRPIQLVMLPLDQTRLESIMRTLTILSIAIAMSSATAFAAPQEPQTEPALSEIQVRSALPVYQLQPQQVADVKGVYVLDNGSTVRITNVNRRLFAQIGERSATELTSTGENRFVSLDQQVTMEYKPIAFGEELVLTYPADQSMSSAGMVRVTLALNR